MSAARLQPQRNSAEEVERRLAAINAGRALNAIISINPQVMKEAQRCDRLWRAARHSAGDKR